MTARQIRRAAGRQALKQARKVTNAQIQANRHNAQYSTGPQTEAGKSAVGQNRTTHGLNYNAATFRVLPCEDQSDYDTLLRRFQTEHQPETPTEHLLILSMPNTAGSSTEPPVFRKPASTPKPAKSPIKSSSRSTCATPQPTNALSTNAFPRF